MNSWNVQPIVSAAMALVIIWATVAQQHAFATEPEAMNVLDSGNALVAQAYNTVGQGRYQQGVDLAWQALQSYEGIDNLSFLVFADYERAHAYAVIAYAYANASQAEESMKFWNLAMKSYRRFFSIDMNVTHPAGVALIERGYPYVVFACDNLAAIHQDLGNLDETLSALQFLADFYQRIERPEQALDVYARIEKLEESMAGSNQ